MAVHAHPDDESSKGAATMARYVAEGVDVLVVTLTGGERGSILNPAMDRPEVLADLANIRRAEMEEAERILGVRHLWLGFSEAQFDAWFTDAGLAHTRIVPLAPDPHAKGPNLFTARAIKRA